MRQRIPAIEIAHEAHPLGLRRDAVEIHRLDIVLGRITVRAKPEGKLINRCVQLVHFINPLSSFAAVKTVLTAQSSYDGAMSTPCRMRMK